MRYGEKVRITVGRDKIRWGGEAGDESFFLNRSIGSVGMSPPVYILFFSPLLKKVWEPVDFSILRQVLL